MAIEIVDFPMKNGDFCMVQPYYNPAVQWLQALLSDVQLSAEDREHTPATRWKQPATLGHLFWVLK